MPHAHPLNSSCLQNVLELKTAGAGQLNAANDAKDGIALVSHALVGLAASLDCKVDTFSLGEAARGVGDSRLQDCLLTQRQSIGL